MVVTSSQERRTSGPEVCAGLELRALAEAARVELDAFPRGQAPGEAELFVSAGRQLSLEYEPGTGASTLSGGEALSAAARVWREERSAHAALPVGGLADLGRVLEAAAHKVETGPRAPLPAPLVAAGPLDASLPELSASRMRERATRLAREVVPPGIVVQAAVLSQSATWSLLARGAGGSRVGVTSSETAFVRCETSRGAIVDAVASPLGGDWDWASLRARLVDGIEALEGPAEAADPSLPVVLRPAVAAPLVAALAWMLRGDVVAATPALSRAVGKKLFPGVLSVADEPLHPLGTQRRDFDDEGAAARPLRLIDEGRLRDILHSAATAAQLGAEANGRGLRAGASLPTPAPVCLFVVPRGDALPPRYTELVARIETFTPMPRPGMVDLVAGGWEVHEGRRVRRVAPVNLGLPVLETFRALRGVGADLAFFPTAEGCGTPTLVFPPLPLG